MVRSTSESDKIDSSVPLKISIRNFGFYMNIKKVKSKVGDRSRGWPEGSLFDSYHTKV